MKNEEKFETPEPLWKLLLGLVFLIITLGAALFFVAALQGN